MIFPRLQLLRDLLSEDGSIWVTIDDNEAHYLKVIMDEIFGRGNFVASPIWNHSVQSKGYSGKFSVHHNYILVYKKSELFSLNDLPRMEEHNINYSNPDNDPRGFWRSGDVRNSLVRPNLMYDIITPSGNIIKHPPKGWRFSKETFERELLEGKIKFSKDEKRIIRKIYLNDQSGRVPETIWFAQDVGTTREANSEIKGFIENNFFDTPKPERLIKRILEIATQENDLVLDSFLGSGTTAAVAHKMKRRYIGIEMGEHAKTHCAARLKKVIDGEQGGISKSVNWQGGGGFCFYTLGEELFTHDGKIHPDVRFIDLAAYIWFYQTRTPWQGTDNSPLLGVHNDTAYYLLYNGILKDISENSGNILTKSLLKTLPKHKGKKVIYAIDSYLDDYHLDAQNIKFCHIPHEIPMENNKLRQKKG